MSKIKICGLTRSEDIYAVNHCKPDYIGFVFASKSRRYVTPAQAAKLKEILSTDIPAVGVFVNERQEHIINLLKHNIIDIAQLHGQETEATVQCIKKATGKPVIKAVSVQKKSDIIQWADSQADYLLFDNGTGGTGQSFDWTLLSHCTKPFFLAGGININNLPQALAKGAYALDISSGAETDGLKDPKKIAAIINIVRTTERSN